MGTLTWGFGKPYGYAGNPRTCFWCGDRLRREWVTDPDSATPGAKIYLTLGGYQGNGRFCSLRCGYQYAVRATRGLGA